MDCSALKPCASTLDSQKPSRQVRRREERARRGAPLGNTERSASGSPSGVRGSSVSVLPDGSRLSKWTLQRAAAELLPKERVAICCRLPHGSTVDLVRHPDAGTASYKGLKTCGSVWLCPICASKISERRKHELHQAVAAAEERGHRVLLVTYTIRHREGDCLRRNVDGLMEARRRSRSGRWAAEFADRWGVLGSVRALEVTHGEEHGWHPHLHELLIVRGDAEPSEVEAELRARWVHVVGQVGLRGVNQHGVTVGVARETVAEYIAKFGRERRWGPEAEVSKAIVKRGKLGSRTPIGLLLDYLAGDEQAGELWRHYGQVFKGRRQLVWSRGLREALGLDQEQSDEELAAEESGRGVPVASLDRRAWAIVVGNDLRGELLEVAATATFAELTAWLERLGLSVLDAGDSVGVLLVSDRPLAGSVT